MSAIPKGRGGQTSVAANLPYSQQIDEHTAITYEGDLTQTIRVLGLPFATMDASVLVSRSNAWFSSLNTFGRQPGTALWTTMHHRPIAYDQSAIQYDNAFSAQLAEALARKNDERPMFVNDLYVSPVVRLGRNELDRWGSRVSTSAAMEEMREDARERMHQASAGLLADLRPYHPTLLGLYEQEGRPCTELGQFYSRLLNGGVERHVPLMRAELSYCIQSAALHFGREVVEIEGPGGSRYAAILSLVAPYTFDNVPYDAFSSLLHAPFETILSQSVTYLPFSKADKALDRQEKLIKSTSNNQEDLKEVREMRQKIGSGKFAFCEHEWICVVYGKTIKELNHNLNHAAGELNLKSINTARVRGGPLIKLYYNILPANFRMGRLYAMTVSSENVSRFAPMHNHMTGNARGSQWGMPIALLRTDADTPYFLNYHVGRQTLAEQGLQLEYEDEEEEATEAAPQAPAVILAKEAPAPHRKPRTHRKELGSYRVIGRSGGGKTVFKLAMRSLARKRPAPGKPPLRSFSFDLHRGEEICIRAAGGAYHRFDAGAPTNINFFWLPDTPESHTHVFNLAAWCARFGASFVMQPDDEIALAEAVRHVFRLPLKARRFGRLLENIQVKHKALRASLSRWCNGGPYAWVADSDVDAFDFEKVFNVGFDITKFIDLDEARTPILASLTYKMKAAAWGHPHIIDFAEAWKVVQDPWMKGYIQDLAKTVRRKDGILGLDTQEPADLSASSIGHTLLSQFPTQFILPNSEARADEYIEALNCTPREYELLRTTPENQGYCLVKQGNESVLVRMDLSGLNEMLAVLSTSEDNLEVMDRLIQQHGPDPALWLPEFYKRRV